MYSKGCPSLIMLLVFSSSILAQHESIKINGTVMDKGTKKPLEYANLVLIHLPDSVRAVGTASDKNGKFTLDAPAGTYLLRCSFIGFDGVETKVFSLFQGQSKYNAGQFQLATGAKELGEVVVTGKKSVLNTSIDRKIYNVDQDVMSKSGSVSDILKNIPSVEVDIDGVVSLRGSTEVMILINGRPSPLMGRTRAEVLQQLPANSIERIEVITNPTARFRPDGTSGIINIVLKKNSTRGLNSTVIFNVGNHSRYNGNITMNYNPGKVNIFASYSVRQDFRGRYNSRKQTFLDSIGNPSRYFNQESKSNEYPLSNIFTTGMDYNLSDHNSIGVSGSSYYRSRTRRDVVNNFSYDNQNVLVQYYDRSRYDPEYEKQLNGTFYFQHKFKKEDEELRLEATTAMSDEQENNHYSNLYSLPKPTSTFDNTLIMQGGNESQITLDYSNPLSESSKLELGYDGLFNRIDFNFYGEYFDTTYKKFVKDPIKSNEFIFQDAIHAIYGTYQKSYKAFGYSVGLRLEQTFIKGHLITMDSLISNAYFKIYPTLHLYYKLKEGSELQLNYSKRVHRPEGEDYNPFPEYQDPRNIRAGNPKLLPEIIHSAEVGYKWQGKNFTFVPSLFYRYKKDAYTSIVIPVNDSVLLTKNVNLSNDQSAGLELIFSAKLGKIFNANLSSTIFYNQIDASNLGYNQKKTIYSMTSNLVTNINFTKSTMMQLSGNYRSARLTPQGKFFPSIVANAGLRQDFSKGKMSGTITVSDIFNSLRQKLEINSAFLLQSDLGRRDGRVIYVGFTYRLGVIKKTKEEKLQFDNSM